MSDPGPTPPLSEAVERVLAADAAIQASNPTPFPVPIGNLAPIVAGAASALPRGDAWSPGLRERAGAVLRGLSIDAVARRFSDGFAGSKPYHILPTSPSPANRALRAVGWAVANPDRGALVHLGTGSTADGAFHEALNLAARFSPNILFLVAVDPLGKGAPFGPQLATRPAQIARAFSIPTTVVDGRDADAVHVAVAAARSAGGPHLIEASL